LVRILVWTKVLGRQAGINHYRNLPSHSIVILNVGHSVSSLRRGATVYMAARERAATKRASTGTAQQSKPFTHLRGNLTSQPRRAPTTPRRVRAAAPMRRPPPRRTAAAARPPSAAATPSLLLLRPALARTAAPSVRQCLAALQRPRLRHKRAYVVAHST